MCWFGYDAKDCDEHSTAGDEERPKGHPWREDIAKEEPCEECVPKEGDCAKRSENNDGEGGNLEDRPEQVGRDEYRCER